MYMLCRSRGQCSSYLLEFWATFCNLKELDSPADGSIYKGVGLTHYKLEEVERSKLVGLAQSRSAAYITARTTNQDKHPAVRFCRFID